MNTFIKNNNVEFWYETFGKKTDPALILIMGNSCDAMMWPDDFCTTLAHKNLYVIRFDQRDTGLSTKIDFNKNPYTLNDMACDVMAILDGLHSGAAHVVGYSTGGTIAQLLAVYYPTRVLSLTLMMTSTDLTIKNDAFAGKDMSNALLPAPKKEFIDAIIKINAKPINSTEDKIVQLVDNFSLANGNVATFNRDFFYHLFKNFLLRLETAPQSNSSIGHKSNHGLATSATPAITRQELLLIKCPTLVIAGGQDPIFPPEHAHSLLQAIPKAELLMIENMGHIITPLFFKEIALAVVKHTKN